MNLNKPKNFIPDKNQNGKDWIIWKTEFQIYLALCQGDKKLSMEEQIYILKNLMGKEAEKAIVKIIFDNENDKEDINILLQKFDELFTVSTNEAEERYNFFSKKKLNDENIDDYIFDLKEKARKCNFDDQTDKFIKDMVIFHIGNKTLQQILLQQDLALYEITALYKQHNNSSKKIKEMCDDNTTDTPNEEFRDSSKCMNVNSNGPEDEKSCCWRCGERHPLKSCPAWGTFCEICEGLHHLTGRCRNGHRSINNSRNRIPRNDCSRCGTRHPFKPCPVDHEECSSYENMPNQLQASSESLNVERNGPEYRKSSCWRCGDKHPLNACPAWGKFCEICKDLHHLTGRCRKYTCSKCGTNHPVKQCPANHEDSSNVLNIPNKLRYSTESLNSNRSVSENRKSSCWRCGDKHPLNACPAWGKFCEICKDLHHLTGRCRKYTCSKCGTNHPVKQCPANHEDSSNVLNIPNKLRYSTESLNSNRSVSENRKSSCWRCGDKHPLNACPAWGKFCEICKDLHHLTGRCRKYTCSKCGTNHPFKQCPANHEDSSNVLNIPNKLRYSTESLNSNKSGRNYKKSSCWRCGDKHPLNACPAWGKFCEICKNQHHLTGRCRKNPCSKCGTNHLFKQCPAYHEQCSSCLEKGHYSSKCKKSKETNETDDAEESCLWCGTRHQLQSQCPHNATCPTCSDFPHNICFQCRKNPHDESCIFKDSFSLPSQIETETGTIYKIEICLWCGTRHHPQSQCPHDATCPTCTNYPHNICFQCRKKSS